MSAQAPERSGLPSGESVASFHGGRWQTVWAVLAGLLTLFLSVAMFPNLDVPEAAYIFLVPWFLWMFYTRPSRRRVLLAGLLVGTGKWIVLLWWLRHYPVQVGLPSVLGYASVLLLGAVLGAFFAAWSIFARWIIGEAAAASAVRRVGSMVALAGAWVVLEWVRSWLFSGFPWLPVAASQWQRPLILQIISITGAWGLSFLLVFFNAGLAFYVPHLLRSRQLPWYRRFSPEFYLAMGLLLLSLAVGLKDAPRTREEPMFVAGFVQPYVRPPDRWNPENYARLQEDYRRVAAYAKFNGAEAILWPEASTPLPAPGHPEAERWLAGLSAELEIPIMMGNLVREPAEDGSANWYNAVITVTPDGGVSPRFAAKRHLVPFGEYVPAWIPFLEKLVPAAGSFVPGSEARVLDFSVAGHRWRVGPLVCYEDLFPRLSRDLVRGGVDFLYVATNDAWYGEEAAAYQHAAHSVLRAVETRRPVLRAGNAGWSGWIDERGQIRHVLRGAEQTIYFQGAGARLVARDPAFAGRWTPYVRWGDWFVVLSGLMTAGVTVAFLARPVPEGRGPRGLNARAVG